MGKNKEQEKNYQCDSKPGYLLCEQYPQYIFNTESIKLTLPIQRNRVLCMLYFAPKWLTLTGFFSQILSKLKIQVITHISDICTIDLQSRSILKTVGCVVQY